MPMAIQAAASGAGSAGNETEYFGNATKPLAKAQAAKEFSCSWLFRRQDKS